MKWTSALSTRPSLEAAVTEVADKAQTALGQAADLALVFISEAFASEYSRLMPLLQARLGSVPILGCGCGGAIAQSASGRPLEIEDEPAIALTLAALPDVQVHPFHLRPEELPDLDSSPDRWVNLLGVDPADNPHFILLGDSMSARINDLLQGLDYAYPQSVKVGGLTAGVSALGGSGLFCKGRLLREGTIGVALSGNISVETIVAQGCRPVGPLLRVAEADRHVLLRVEANPEGERWETAAVDTKAQTALEALHRALDTLDEEDRTKAQNALSIGIVRDAFKANVETGDFLIRNLIGVDPRIGAIAIGDRIRPGQRVQFHLRDADASAEDLEMLLIDYQEKNERNPSPAGALLFDCLGRGERFYNRPNFDTQLFRQYVGETPIGGFFCQGEIGPIGSATFLHGYTAVFALFRPLAENRS
ncbi:FIST N-terminal domain-containing protein [Altericista sp. CCNU0014]|uniref:FIST signal transduction protein n=1 Tax=Altericista sp. CCNU0014 TaxID=3082949 RepID=UPI00384C8BE0